MPEKSCGSQQAGPTTHLEDVDGPVGDADSSGSEGEAEPMVSRPIKPFVLQIVLEGRKQRKCSVSGFGMHTLPHK